MSFLDSTVGAQHHSQPVAPTSPQTSLIKWRQFSALAEQLKTTFSGPIFVRSEQDFPTQSPQEQLEGEQAEEGNTSEFCQSTKVFNTAAVVLAWIVVQPRNTEDVVT